MTTVAIRIEAVARVLTMDAFVVFLESHGVFFLGLAEFRG
jgi:hypothetical protein